MGDFLYDYCSYVAKCRKKMKPSKESFRKFLIEEHANKEWAVEKYEIFRDIAAVARLRTVKIPNPDKYFESITPLTIIKPSEKYQFQNQFETINPEILHAFEVAADAARPHFHKQ